MKRWAIIAILIMGIGAVAAPVSASHGEDYDGLYWAIDEVDGSFMLLRITERPDASLRVVLFDTLGTVACDPDAPVRAAGSAAIDVDGDLAGEFTRVRCLGATTLTPTPFPFEFRANPDGTLSGIAGIGDTWYPIAG